MRQSAKRRMNNRITKKVIKTLTKQEALAKARAARTDREE